MLSNTDIKIIERISSATALLAENTEFSISAARKAHANPEQRNVWLQPTMQIDGKPCVRHGSQNNDEGIMPYM